MTSGVLGICGFPGTTPGVAVIVVTGTLPEGFSLVHPSARVANPVRRTTRRAEARIRQISKRGVGREKHESGLGRAGALARILTQWDLLLAQADRVDELPIRHARGEDER